MQIQEKSEQKVKASPAVPVAREVKRRRRTKTTAGPKSGRDLKARPYDVNFKNDGGADEILIGKRIRRAAVLIGKTGYDTPGGDDNR